MQALEYHSLNNLNTPIYFKGLTPMQFMGGIFIPLVLVLASVYAGIVSLLVIFYLGSLIYKNQKDGNPDYLQGLVTFTVSPRTIEDPNQVLKYLIR